MSLDVDLYMDVDVGLDKPKRVYFFEANITHNLGKMAGEAGIYYQLWRPEEIGVKRAGEIIKPLEQGLFLMKSQREEFEKFNAKNGWGLYKHFVPWIEKYLDACKKHPNAKIEISR